MNVLSIARQAVRVRQSHPAADPQGRLVRFHFQTGEQSGGAVADLWVVRLQRDGKRWLGQRAERGKGIRRGGADLKEGWARSKVSTSGIMGNPLSVWKRFHRIPLPTRPRRRLLLASHRWQAPHAGQRCGARWRAS